MEQTFDDFQVLVVDGGSKDSTLEQIQRWSANDARVVLHPAPVAGLYQAFNQVLTSAETPYVCILPADDSMSNCFLQRMIFALEEYPGASAAVSRLRVFDENDHPLPSPWDHAITPFERAQSPATTSLHPWPFDALAGLMRQNPYVSQTQLVYRTRAIDRLRFETDLGSTADILFNLQLAFAHDVVHVAETWGGWRLHPAQASQQDSQRSLKKQRLEVMLDRAVESHLSKINDQRYRRRLEQIADVMAGWNHLQESVEGQSHARRWATVFARGMLSPRASWLYAQSRLGRTEAVRDWLTDQARRLTRFRLDCSLRQNDRHEDRTTTA